MKNIESQFINNKMLLCLMVPILILISCNPTEPPITPPSWSYHYPVDSVYKLIENFEYSYTTQDIGNYMQCFRSGFEFYYESSGDTLSWGFETEQEIHQSMFNQVDRICLEFSGTEQYPWSGDTTECTVLLPREYDLAIFAGLDDSTCIEAYGTAEFICRRDSAGEWYIWQWWDYPDPEKDGWSDLKVLFMSSPL